MRGTGATLAAGVLLVLFGWMAASVSREHSTTADEIFYITSGYSYWKLDDFRLSPDAGNLPQRWAAWPLLARDLHFPTLDQPAWLGADVGALGYQFFYHSGNDPARMLQDARIMIALLGVACGALVFAWSRSLFGLKGALVSTALFAFCPNLLAHAGLATSDMAVSLGFLAAGLAGWRLLHRVTPGRVAAAGVTAALLGLSKFSAPLLLPMLGLMALARAVRGAALPVRVGGVRTRARGWRAAWFLTAAFSAAALLGGALIWGAYGFRYAGLRGAGQYNQPWDEVLMTTPPSDQAAPAVSPDPAAATRPHPGVVQAVVRPMREWHALPEPWLYGLTFVDRFSRSRVAFFFGEIGSTGWVAFFPTAFLLKTPLPVLALLALAGVVLATRPRSGGRASRRFYRLTPLAALGAVYAGFALSSHLNLGLRHLLPLYPVLYVGAGAVALGFHRRWLVIATAVLLAWHAGESLAIRPHYLAYFNPLRGGPRHAYQYFVDSSLDWGQDLPGLKRWLDAHARGESIFLSYFGSGSPKDEGITATRLADGNLNQGLRPVAPPMTGGVYCISATMFQQIYTYVRHGWTPAHERRYAELSAWADAWWAGFDRTPRETAAQLFNELEHLRFGRLCAGLQRRTPDDEVGYSILIFRLTDAEVRSYLAGPPPYVR
jgi:hypothetical protein